MIKPLLLAIATLAFAIAPAFSPPFRGFDPGQFPVLITRPAIQPAGYAFAIWGLIYGWMILHAGFGLIRRSDDPAWDAVRAPLIGAALMGTLWLNIATRAPLTATATILAMAALALAAYLRAHQTQDRWLLAAPLSILAGWLTAASAVSVGVMLAGYGWLSNSNAALVMLACVLATALTVQSRRPQMPLYGLTITWATIAAAIANRADLPTVTIAAAAGAAIMALATIALRAIR
jgi:hypothetical protein